MVRRLWGHRTEITRWGRSLWSEIATPGKVDPQRLRIIGTVLWRITSDPQLSKAPELRRVALDADNRLSIDAAAQWFGRHRLIAALSDVDGITGFVDGGGRPISDVIDIEPK